MRYGMKVLGRMGALDTAVWGGRSRPLSTTLHRRGQTSQDEDLDLGSDLESSESIIQDITGD